MRFTAHPGRGEELAALLLRVADGLAGVEGCVTWLVARDPGAPDQVWVQELWASEAHAEAALTPPPRAVTARGRRTSWRSWRRAPERTDLEVLGGVGA